MPGKPQSRAIAAHLPRYVAVAVGLAATLWLLKELRSVLQPVVLALLIWFLLGAVARLIARKARGPDAVPGGGAYLASGVFFFATTAAVVMLLSDSVAGLRENLPTYRANLAAMLQPLAEAVGLTKLPQLSELTAGVDLATIALGLLGSAAGSFGQIVIIACIVFFIFAEARFFEAKLSAIIGDGSEHRDVTDLLSEIGRKIETYLGLKCFIGIVQAVPTYLILALVGVDSPIVWAVCIFFLSFIPTLGTLIGIALPTLLALVQFDSPVNFFVTLACLAPVQLLASNWLEPRITGSSLNLSPLAVFITIFAGGAVWGIVGAIISVPALTVAAIALAQSPRTRPIAVALSQDGRLMD
ncbi:MAG: AI-2E family transporter [Pseudomonadota bacterium]